MTAKEKWKLTLEILANQALLDNNASFRIILNRFPEKNIEIAEAVALLGRLIREKALVVTSISQAENTIKDLVSRIVEAANPRSFDLVDLDQNILDATHVLFVRLQPSFIDLLRDTAVGFPEDEVIELAKLLSGATATFKAVWPLKVYCPFCRSLSAEILDQSTWSTIQEKQAQGHFSACKDRNHKMKMVEKEGKLIFELPLKNPEVAKETESTSPLATVDESSRSK